MVQEFDLRFYPAALNWADFPKVPLIALFLGLPLLPFPSVGQVMEDSTEVFT